jgi:hypothetical protein
MNKIKKPLFCQYLSKKQGCFEETTHEIRCARAKRHLYAKRWKKI